MAIRKNGGLAQQVSRHLTAAIRSGEYKPGDRLPPEAELASQLGVSRTILREALASLKNDGILESRQGIGLTIREPGARQAFRFSDVVETISTGDANYLYEMRAILESDAAGQAARRLGPGDAAEIRMHFDAMAAAVRNHESGDEAHEAFNAAIARAGRNIFLIEFLAFLHARLRSLAKELRLSTMMDAQRAALVLHEHEDIAQAILSGDPRAARESTLRHLRNAAERAGLNIFVP
jgi:DNA-binding FadR family transcriptional regulator